jgi:hypothetical protein
MLLMMSGNIARNMYSSQGKINYPTQLRLVGYFRILRHDARKEAFQQNLRKCSNVKLYGNKYSENRVACGQTHREVENQTNVKNLEILRKRSKMCPPPQKKKNLKTQGRRKVRLRHHNQNKI